MKRVLGIDFGQVRIGLAVSDELRWLAHPLMTLPADAKAVARITEIVREKEVDLVVVGIPKQMSGKIGIAAEEALEFVNKLRTSLRCEVLTWDERLTTVAAHRALRETGKKTHQTRAYVDQVAAQMILQSYLDSQRTAET
jgi:putative Holliday junction resolvase